MAKHDWKVLQSQFEHDHAKYGTGAKEWCEAKGLNYASARRYIKVRKAAQSDNAQKRSAQTAQSNPKSKLDKKKVRQEKLHQDKNNTSDSSAAALKKPKADRPQRDDKGLFLPKNTVSVGCPGNPNPENQFQPGNQISRKGGIYARYFPEQKQVMFDASEIATLDDELMLTRVRLQSGIEYLAKIAEDLQTASSMEERISLYESYVKTQAGLDSLTSRIESITNTMSKLGIDVVNKEKIIADTGRIKNASRKLALESDAIQNAGKGDETPVSEMLDDIRSMSTNGLMSDS
ncbi:hypothetical protein SBX64_16005 [Vibrio rhizosphaerae]|uniref:Terminase n=1 Tax=Vibrio rhizosphaerae TaxID=398736 RepID=A0ABU4IYP4_9VIBR|nr:hypothetical protein [Vibrio rhizosphaerae]MDW6094043.1 hypothetical protein [Vibrio rhizosphaerae]